MSAGELACPYASLILFEDGIAITPENISKLLKAANVKVEPNILDCFCKLFEKISMEELIRSGPRGVAANEENKGYLPPAPLPPSPPVDETLAATQIGTIIERIGQLGVTIPTKRFKTDVLCKTNISPKKILMGSSDGDWIEVEEYVAFQFTLYKDFAEYSDENEPIRFENITTKILLKLIEYCEKHGNPERRDVDKVDLKKWEAEFTEVDVAVLYDLLNAANFVNIPSLLELLYQKVADMIAGRTPDQIRETFRIEENFTPDEMEEIIKEQLFTSLTSHEHEKLGPRARKNIFIRYSESSKGYVMYGEHPNGGMIEVESRDIDFIKIDFPSIGDANKDLDLYELEEDEVILPSSSEGGELVHCPIIVEDSEDSLQPSGSDPQEQDQARRVSSRGHIPRRHFDIEGSVLLCATKDKDKPASFSEILSSSASDEWMTAM
ncbi:hypothetical protein HHK36_007980 [Tetracentron sinense]|uniref:Uncharacterized protein n=1 Tax=Tetracentron sinense TaxID=13715 RepID=A0A835DMT2_TETSI|nr:hypothetical protein HHK36_007980 [Tetracentron sinense]